MADISNEIRDFREAVYGEEVRGSMISLAEKVNKESTDAKGVAESYRDSAKAYATTATQKATEASNSAAIATQKASEVSSSVATAVQKATEASNSATTAAQKAAEASSSASAAKTSETNSKTSETNALANKNAAAISASTAAQKAAEASGSAVSAAASETNAATSKAAAKASETNAEDFSKKSESYAVGTGNVYRDGDATDNSEFYCNQSKVNSDIAKQYLAKVEQAGNEAVEKINQALDMDVPNFVVDLSTMNLLYSGGRFDFRVHNGYLEWGLAV